MKSGGIVGGSQTKVTLKISKGEEPETVGKKRIEKAGTKVANRKESVEPTRRSSRANTK